MRIAPCFRFPEGGKIAVERLNRRWARAKLPKLGWVRFRVTRPLGGKVKNATVSRDGKHWYISFLVEDGLITPGGMPARAVRSVSTGVWSRS